MYSQLPKQGLLNCMEFFTNAIQVSNCAQFEDLLKYLKEIVQYKSCMALLASTNADGHYCYKEVCININFPEHWVNDFISTHSPSPNVILENHFQHYKTQLWAAKISTDKKSDKDNGSSALNSPEKTTHGICFGKFSARLRLGSMFLMSADHQFHHKTIETINHYLHQALLRCYFSEKHNKTPKLSNRELEIMRWVKEGKTNWEISQILNISERTVKSHFTNIYRKYNVYNRTGALSHAVKYGLV